jgi:hypothetical protein
LTADLAELQIHRKWWADESLVSQFDPSPIDRHWNWNEIGIEYVGPTREKKRSDGYSKN